MEGPALAVVAAQTTVVAGTTESPQQQQPNPGVQQHQAQRKGLEQGEQQPDQEEELGQDQREEEQQEQQQPGECRSSKPVFSLKKPTLLPKSLHYRPQTQEWRVKYRCGGALHYRTFSAQSYRAPSCAGIASRSSVLQLYGSEGAHALALWFRQRVALESFVPTDTQISEYAAILRGEASRSEACSPCHEAKLAQGDSATSRQEPTAAPTMEAVETPSYQHAPAARSGVDAKEDAAAETAAAATPRFKAAVGPRADLWGHAPLELESPFWRAAFNGKADSKNCPRVGVKQEQLQAAAAVARAASGEDASASCCAPAAAGVAAAAKAGATDVPHLLTAHSSAAAPPPKAAAADTVLRLTAAGAAAELPAAAPVLGPPADTATAGPMAEASTAACAQTGIAAAPASPTSSCEPSTGAAEALADAGAVAPASATLRPRTLPLLLPLLSRRSLLGVGAAPSLQQLQHGTGDAGSPAGASSSEGLQTPRVESGAAADAAHRQDQEWRARYYVGPKRCMRTFSAKLYGFERARERAHSFIRYIQLHGRLPAAWGARGESGEGAAASSHPSADGSKKPSRHELQQVQPLQQHLGDQAAAEQQRAGKRRRMDAAASPCAASSENRSKEQQGAVKGQRQLLLHPGEQQLLMQQQEHRQLLQLLAQHKSAAATQDYTRDWAECEAGLGCPSCSVGLLRLPGPLPLNGKGAPRGPLRGALLMALGGAPASLESDIATILNLPATRAGAADAEAAADGSSPRRRLARRRPLDPIRAVCAGLLTSASTQCSALMPFQKSVVAAAAEAQQARVTQQQQQQQAHDPAAATHGGVASGAAAPSIVLPPELLLYMQQAIGLVAAAAAVSRSSLSAAIPDLQQQHQEEPPQGLAETLLWERIIESCKGTLAAYETLGSLHAIPLPPHSTSAVAGSTPGASPTAKIPHALSETSPVAKLAHSVFYSPRFSVKDTQRIDSKSNRRQINSSNS
ncbi:hypothetical protein cyc_01318 [Cyclospora cayetanensis]|uniref:Uncharacterized protein n=1 Tax=Cyclospora cayetanensis TaxID=88456 RepID=A0A1D3D9B9_9EIME|nr:hypothetical protein cyc_01318 [Cyclospora cayetanensis]